MKIIVKYLAVILIFFTFSCEEVVEVDLDKGKPRLVVEASILWLNGTSGNTQTIKIQRTTPFYEQEISPVEDAIVTVTSEEGDIYDFTYLQDGNYITQRFEPELNLEYTLEILHEDQVYIAKEKLLPVSPIDYVEQTESGGFSGNDIEIKAFYTDPALEENFYFFKFYDEDVMLEFYEDEFTNGNQIFGYYSDENIEVGDQIEIVIQGISKSYYEYLFILRSQVGSNDGGPFETMPATVKGNIINTTKPDNYPLGYFRLSQADSITYTVE